ncbi:hypothetical protein ACRALDRAFT_213135 [Sodiomyces alcalophilus JCM 7366]|uniref:uncharacterized protein n=1 Tax=Sodiomyces alcalophilus JCM 7366 TaxID=591952 RepID=UPI0039B63B59
MPRRAPPYCARPTSRRLNPPSYKSKKIRRCMTLRMIPCALADAASLGFVRTGANRRHPRRANGKGVKAWDLVTMQLCTPLSCPDVSVLVKTNSVSLADIEFPDIWFTQLHGQSGVLRRAYDVPAWVLRPDNLHQLSAYSQPAFTA